MENIANIIATVIIIAMAIGGCIVGNISVIGCIVDCTAFFIIGIGPSLIQFINKKSTTK